MKKNILFNVLIAVCGSMIYLNALEKKEENSNKYAALYQRISTTEQHLQQSKTNYFIAKNNFESCRVRSQERAISYTLSGGLLGYIVGWLRDEGAWHQLRIKTIKGTAIGSFLGLCAAQAKTLYVHHYASTQSITLPTSFSSLDKKAEYENLKNKYQCSNPGMVCLQGSIPCASHNVKKAETDHKNALIALHEALQSES